MFTIFFKVTDNNVFIHGVLGWVSHRNVQIKCFHLVLEPRGQIIDKNAYLFQNETETVEKFIKFIK